MLIAFAGSHVILNGHLLSMDEWTNDFHGRMLATGNLVATLPPEWAPFGSGLQPIFVRFEPSSQTWHSEYLPVYSALRAVGHRLHVSDMVNPALAVGTLVSLSIVVRRIWPSEPALPVLAALFLAASPQFLINSMTAYSMPADLCLNLIWLALFLHRTTLTLALAPWLGIAALGVHTSLPHALFVFPFLLRIVWERRWKTATYFALVYGAGCVLWYLWLAHFHPAVVSGGGSLGPRGGGQSVLLMFSLGLLASWQPLALSVLFLVGMARWRSMPPVLRDLAVGFFATILFYTILFPADQGHGWGYRYAYSVLGSLVVIAIHGWVSARPSPDVGPLHVLVGASLIFAIVVQFPLRSIQIQQFVAPFARAEFLVQSSPASIVLVDRLAGWYAQDLVRNDPWLTNSPKVMFSHRLLTEGLLGQVRERWSTWEVMPADLDRVGIPREFPAAHSAEEVPAR
jgi:hypothetical protein